MLDLSPTKLDLARKYLENVEVVIVDEMSLVSSDNLYNLHHRLVEIFDCEEPFGGRCVLLVGDILQLPPIKASQIFTAPRKFDSKIMFKSDKLNLWENCSSVSLDTNFRQGEGQWLEMLNRFRIGEATDEDIKILESRQWTLLSNSEYNNATHLFFTNVDVNLHNDDMLNLLNGKLVVVKADVNPKNLATKPNKNGQIDNSQFVINLTLKVGARVIVISNIDIKDSLVNGSLGVILDIKTNEKGKSHSLKLSLEEV